MDRLYKPKLHPTINSVCIDVDTIRIFEDSNNSTYGTKELNKKTTGFNQNEHKDWKSNSNYLLKNFDFKHYSANTFREKRQRYAKRSQRKVQKVLPSLVNIVEDKEQVQSEVSKKQKDSVPNEDILKSEKVEKKSRSNSKDLHHMHFVPRKSLLGKPIVSRNCSRQDAQYRKLQSKIYNFLERPKNCNALGYHILVFASVFTCLVLSVLSTIDDIGEYAGEMLFYVELSVLFWFFTEYCLRLWSAGCRSRYQTWKGRLLFARQPFCIVDLVVIMASVIVLALGSDRQMFAASALRGLRFFQILRMIRMDRRGGSWKLLASVVWAHRQELFTTIYIGFLALVFSSFLIYLAEKDEKDKINSYADALWWGVITLCTVGYGDTVPKTALGKIIAGCCALAGISFFALPAGILGSGFALKVQQHQRHKHLIRRRMPAATLIQCLWRCYSSDPQSTSIATWKPHLKDSTMFSSISTADKLAKFSRISNIKNREKIHNINSSTNCLSHSLSSSTIGLNSYIRNSSSNDNEPVEDDPEEEDSDHFNLYSNLGFSVSRRNALAQSVDKCQKEESSSKKKFGMLDDFLLHRYTSLSSMNRIEDEWETFLPKRELTGTEKHAIRFIRKVKFFVASRKFKEALRPYDLKDIIEQYSSGHVDMLARIKGLQLRWDNLFGRSDIKVNDGYDSRPNLASRLIKIETKVESIENKLDKFIQLYKQHNSNKQIQNQYNLSSKTLLHERNAEKVRYYLAPLTYDQECLDGLKKQEYLDPDPSEKVLLKDSHLNQCTLFSSTSDLDVVKKKYDEV